MGCMTGGWPDITHFGGWVAAGRICSTRAFGRSEPAGVVSILLVLGPQRLPITQYDAAWAQIAWDRTFSFFGKHLF